MELEFVLIADAVENVNGKLYLLGGGWYQFTSHSFPPLRASRSPSASRTTNTTLDSTG